MARDMGVSGPTLSSPIWAQDFLGPEHLIPGGAKLLASAFHATDAVFVDVGAAGAAQGATSVPVGALTGAIPNGTVLDFGTNKFARLTAAAAAGATSLTVTALVTALVDADTTWYEGVGKKTVYSGTVIGRTIAERDAETPYGPAASSDDEIFIVAFDVYDLTQINDVELVRHKTVIKETFLPGWSAVASGVKTLVRAAYHCTIGRA